MRATTGYIATQVAVAGILRIEMPTKGDCPTVLKVSGGRGVHVCEAMPTARNGIS
jgi:hypothetical protein